MIKYDKLWETMKSKGITQYDLYTRYHMNRSQLNRLRHNQNVEVNTIDKLCNILNCKVEEIMTHYADDNVFWNMKKEPTILVDYWLLSFLYSVSFIYLYDRFPSSANFLLQFQSAPHCMAAVNGSTAWIYQSGRSCPRICFFFHMAELRIFSAEICQACF